MSETVAVAADEGMGAEVLSVSAEQSTQDVVFDVGNVTLRFGGVVSLNDVSLHLYRGEILAIIGPNGAGKTSLFNSLTGVYTPRRAGSRCPAARAPRSA